MSTIALQDERSRCEKICSQPVNVSSQINLSVAATWSEVTFGMIYSLPRQVTLPNTLTKLHSMLCIRLDDILASVGLCAEQYVKPGHIQKDQNQSLHDLVIISFLIIPLQPLKQCWRSDPVVAFFQISSVCEWNITVVSNLLSTRDVMLSYWAFLALPFMFYIACYAVGFVKY